MRRPTARTLIVLSLATASALALAGCGPSTPTPTQPSIPQGFQESSPSSGSAGGSPVLKGAQLGQQIFETGNGADGNPIPTSSGMGGPCARCHGADGTGAIGPDIRWKVLTGAQQSAGTGPRFTLKDESAFGKAITTGDAGGGQLRGMMPHFNLTAEQISAIAAYLKTL